MHRRSRCSRRRTNARGPPRAATGGLTEAEVAAFAEAAEARRQELEDKRLELFERLGIEEAEPEPAAAAAEGAEGAEGGAAPAKAEPPPPQLVPDGVGVYHALGEVVVETRLRAQALPPPPPPPDVPKFAMSICLVGRTFAASPPHVPRAARSRFTSAGGPRAPTPEA